MKKAVLLLLALVVVTSVIVGVWFKTAGHPDALRHIVLDQCLPGQLQHRNPAPCAQVKPDAGYVVFKDRNGPLQYLLMPTYRINGSESPLLTKAQTPQLLLAGMAGAQFYASEARRGDTQQRGIAGH